MREESDFDIVLGSILSAHEQADRDKQEVYDVYAARRDEHIENFRIATDTEVLDVVYGAYQEMSDGLATVVDNMSEGEKTYWLKEMGDPTFKDSAFYVAKELDIDKNTVAYRAAATVAFDRFFKQGLEDGNFKLCLDLVTTLKDPLLAGVLLAKFDYKNSLMYRYSKQEMKRKSRRDQRIYYKIAMDRADTFDEAVTKHVRTEEVIENEAKFMKSGVIRAIAIALSSRFRTRQALEERIKTEIKEPLRKIKQMLPIEMQILENLLNKTPIETQDD